MSQSWWNDGIDGQTDGRTDEQGWINKALWQNRTQQTDLFFDYYSCSSSAIVVKKKKEKLSLSKIIPMVPSQLILNGLNLDIFCTLVYGLLSILTSVVDFEHIFNSSLDKKAHRTERYHLKMSLGILSFKMPLSINAANAMYCHETVCI